MKLTRERAINIENSKSEWMWKFTFWGREFIFFTRRYGKKEEQRDVAALSKLIGLDGD